MQEYETLVIGGGSAGLAVSHELSRHGIDHVMPHMGSVVARYDLVTVETGTRLRYRCGEPQGALMRLMRPMVARQMRRTAREALVRLRLMLAESTDQGDGEVAYAP